MKRVTSKYRNQKVVTPHGSFDSKREYRRYQELLLLQRAGKISELSLDEIADIDEAIAGRIAQHAAGHCVTVAPDRGKNYRLKGVMSL